MKELADALCDRARSAGVQFMDVRIIEESGNSVRFQNSSVDTVSSERSLRAGVRVLENDAWGFAGVSAVNPDSLSRALENARDMARACRARILHPGVVKCVEPVAAEVAEPCEIDPTGIPIEKKIRYLADQDRAVRNAHGEEIANCSLLWRDNRRTTWLGNTFGTSIAVERSLSYMTAGILAGRNGKRQQASERRAILGGWELAERNAPETFAVRAARRAVNLLEAAPAPGGRFPVVFAPALTGLLIHESLGHNAEADRVFGGRSILEGMIGREIASPLVSVYDDSTIPGAHGSFQYDDEGVPGRKRAIIENGVLKGFLHSLETAARFGVEPTGNGRAAWAFKTPIVRMSNTYIAPGESTFEEMIRSIDRGVYVRRASGGSVQTENGQFSLFVTDAVMIRKGDLAEPLTGVVLNGLILETLKDIDMVGSDFALDKPSFCGKDGQSAPVDGGGPHIRVKEMVVGGRGEGA